MVGCLTEKCLINVFLGEAKFRTLRMYSLKVEVFTVVAKRERIGSGATHKARNLG